MKKFLIVLLAAFTAFTAFQASGQETFGVAYTTNDGLSEFERGLLEVLDVAYMKADFSGNLGNKRIYVEEIVCRDGKFETHVVLAGDYPYPNVNDMRLFVRRISQDSINVKMAFGDNRYYTRNITLRNDKYFIKMETGVKELMKNEANVLRDTLYYPLGVDIPVMAYTTGIWTEKDFGDGEIWTGFDLCGLRDAQIHPREWHKEFGIKNYIYYTVRFE